MTARRVAGGFLALLGAVGVTASAYLNWYDDRTPETAPIDRLFQSGVTEPASSYWTSVALPLAIVTALAVVGLLLRSRLVLAVGWLVGAATLVLFVVQLANDTADFSIGDLQTGAWVALAGLIVMLIGLSSMGGRPAPEAEEPERVSVLDGQSEPAGYAAGTGAAAAPSSSAAASVPPAAPPAPEPLSTEPTPDPMGTELPRRPMATEPPPEPTPEPMPEPGPAPAPAPEPEPGPLPEPEPSTPWPDEPVTPPPPEDEPPRPA